jgi:Uma2 family endonuclease
MATAATAEALMTKEEYARLPDRGVPTELVRGRVVEMNVPAPRHGEICIRIALLIGPHIEANGLGRLVGNDGGVVTKRDPDSVRGADLAFYSFARIPSGPVPPGYLDVVPELVFEVRSPTDRWPPLMAKVSEYLDAGVSVVCVLDERSASALVCLPEEMPVPLRGDEEFHLPDILGELRIPVSRFFA